MTSDTVLMGFVGDVLVDRETPLDAFTDVRAMLAAPQLLFGNLEGAFSSAPRPLPTAGVRLVAGPHNLDALPAIGFDVLSMANNHAVDAGHEALLQAIERLHAAGVKTCGAGAHLDAAREPAVVEAGGLRLAFLAYASVFPAGYEATADRPGVAPFRARDTYLPRTDYQLPGTFPHIRSIPEPQDLEALREDIRRARERADLVIVSFHWGDALHPFLLTDHERKTARLCIEAGADMIVGHHHHTLRGMEWYRGKPILYGLGHFVFDCRLITDDPALTGYEHAVFPREGWPLLPMHPDARMTMMVFATASASGFDALGVVPCRLRPDGRVHPLHPHSAQGLEVMAYLSRCNVSQRLDGALDDVALWNVGGASAVPVRPRRR
jgi:poly-gamma-glutamate synthesis protein (capsule biosynthesis protein)